MRVNRTSTGRTGGSSGGGRGRMGDAGYTGGTRGTPARGRSSSSTTGYTRQPPARENPYAREQRTAGFAREPQQKPSYERPAKSPYARKIPARFIAILVGLVGLVVVLVVIFSSPRAKATDVNNLSQIAAGVKINGTDVSGQDVDDLSRKLKSEMLKKIDEISVTLTYGDQKWTLSGADLGETDNVDDVMGKVSLLAHVGSQEQRRADAQKYREQGYEATVEVKPDAAKLKAKLEELAATINQNGHNADVHFNWLVDIADPDHPTQEEISKMFKITPEQQGQAVDVDATSQNIINGIKGNPKCSVQLVVKPFVPQFTSENLKQCQNLLSVFSTHISSVSTKQRTANIKLALSKFNGLTLWPGQELSFNDTTGARTASAGYQMAHVISGGTYVDDWGGGVCQASTTLYNAAVLAGLTIPDSGPHTIPSDYVKSYVGFDAMVNYGRSDLVIKNLYAGPSKNATALPVFIRAFVTDNNNVYVLFFGAPLPDGEKVDRESDTISKGPVPIAVTQVDTEGKYIQFVEFTDEPPYEVNKPHPDMVVESYRLWKDASGAVINKELLRKDHYPEVEGLTVTGAKIRPTPTPGPQASPASGGT